MYDITAESGAYGFGHSSTAEGHLQVLLAICLHPEWLPVPWDGTESDNRHSALVFAASGQVCLHAQLTSSLVLPCPHGPSLPPVIPSPTVISQDVYERGSPDFRPSPLVGFIFICSDHL